MRHADRSDSPQNSRRTPYLVLLWLLCTVIGTLSLALPSDAPALTATNGGISIDAGAFGRFLLTYPALNVGQSDPIKPLEQIVQGNRAMLKYVGDVRIEVTGRM